MRNPINTAKTLSRLLLIGETDEIKPGVLLTTGSATYPFIRWEKTSDGRDAIRIGLWKDRDNRWVVDGTANLGGWSISDDQDYKNFPHLLTDGFLENRDLKKYP